MNKLYIMSQDGSKIVPYGAIKIKKTGIFKIEYQIIVQYFIGNDYLFSNVGSFRSELVAKQVLKEISSLISGGPALIVYKGSGIDGKTLVDTFKTSVVMSSSEVDNSVKQLDGDRVYLIPKSVTIAKSQPKK